MNERDIRWQERPEIGIAFEDIENLTDWEVSVLSKMTGETLFVFEPACHPVRGFRKPGEIGRIRRNEVGLVRGSTTGTADAPRKSAADDIDDSAPLTVFDYHSLANFPEPKSGRYYLIDYEMMMAILRRAEARDTPLEEATSGFLMVDPREMVYDRVRREIACTSLMALPWAVE